MLAEVWIVFFFISYSVLLKKLGHLSFRVFHVLDLADCILILTFLMFHCPFIFCMCKFRA